MTVLYWIVSYVALVVLSPYALIRTLFGDQCWRERLTIAKPPSLADIWIHASSVGEVRVVSYLVEFLKRTRANLRIHVTVATRNGYATATSVLQDTCSVTYLPLDIPVLVDRTLTLLSPRVLVIAETEIWPHVVSQAHRGGVPIVAVNARMTERAQRRYLWARGFFTSLLSRYDHFFFKTAIDAERYAVFGVTKDRTTVSGDMKFDAPLAERARAAIQNVRASIGVGETQFLLVAGSTRPREEQVLMQVYKSLKAHHPQLRLAIAPRHLERTQEIVAIAQLENLSCTLYTEMQARSASPATDPVVLINTMGRLNDLYLAADLAFVGGTLADIGGHNLLEPVWSGTPVLFGPSLWNVRDAADYILEHNYGQLVRDGDEMASTVEDVLTGRLKLTTKTEHDLGHSATALAGTYILSKLNG